MTRLLILLTLLFGGNLYGQFPSVKFCNDSNYHPVDIKARELIDSLQKTGVDTIFFYRDWLGMNGYNGYGKLIWLSGGVLQQYQINFKNHGDDYGIKSIIYSNELNYNPIKFFFDNHVGTAKAPEPRESLISHDSNHFVYIGFSDKSICKTIIGEELFGDKDNLWSQLVFMVIVGRYKI